MYRSLILGMTTVYNSERSSYYFSMLLRWRRRPGTPSALALPGLVPLLLAEVVSSMGAQFAFLALPWLVLTSTGSPAQMGWVMTAELVPVALFGVYGGVLAARIGPRRWMIFADVIRGFIIALVPVLHAVGVLSLPILLGVAFALGLFTAPYLASQQTIVGDLVGEESSLLASAASLLQGAVRTTVLLGPPVAAVLITAVGAPFVLALNALTYWGAAYLVARRVRTAVAPAPQDLGGARAGMRTLWSDRLLRYWTLGTVLTEAAWQALFVAIPVFAYTRYGGDVRTVGLVVGAFGVGALTGSLLAVIAVRRFAAVRLTTAGKVTQGLLFTLLLLPLDPFGLAACLLVAGLFNGITNGPAAAVRLGRITPGLRPQTLTIFSAITTLGGAAGLVIGGMALEALGDRATLLGMVIMQVLGFSLFVVGTCRQGEGPATTPAPTVDRSPLPEKG
ncbi:MFS transporter [Streptomyces sp. NPDC051218]|uniref:MFS transporter n=1 Tax=Streptomyces sp. NPDC051218 TaxID=3365645 RepID=UPI0037B3E55C